MLKELGVSPDVLKILVVEVRSIRQQHAILADRERAMATSGQSHDDVGRKLYGAAQSITQAVKLSSTSLCEIFQRIIGLKMERKPPHLFSILFPRYLQCFAQMT